MIYSVYQLIERFAAECLHDEEYAHTRRVVSAALEIASTEPKADKDIVTAACFLHDVGRAERFARPGMKHAAAGAAAAYQFLTEAGWSEEAAAHVKRCIQTHSASGGEEPESVEAKILFDADKYDQCGAIGIARFFGEAGICPDEYLKYQKKQRKRRFYTNRGRELAAERLEAADRYAAALKSELSSVHDKGVRLLRKTLRDEPFINRRLLLTERSCFSMEGYYLWGASVIEAAGAVHLFAARWRENLHFPEGALIGSEIIHAVSASADGGFQYADTAVRMRPRGYWDSQMAAAPSVVRCGSVYVMYYTGGKTASPETHSIGYAFSKSISGPWTRGGRGLNLGGMAVHPSALVYDNLITLAFENGEGGIGLAQAKRYDGEYKVLTRNLIEGVILTEPFLFHDRDGYALLAADAEGMGVLYRSDDGVYDWRYAEQAYDNTLIRGDLSVVKVEQRAHPGVFLNPAGRPAYLYTSVYSGGKAEIVIQPLNCEDGFVPEKFAIE